MFTADDVILSTDRKDISGMLVDEKETKLTFSRGLTKYNTLGYKDKTDYITFPADTYDKTEHAVVTLPFVLQDTIMYTKGDDKYNLAEGKDARLLLNDGTKSIQIAKRPTNGAVFTYRTLTLSSFTISGLEFETLADTFWRGYIGAFSVSPRIVTKRARLTPDFVQGLSFSKAIFDGQNYYMLLRVSDYNKYGLATLEMALIDGIELESVDLTNVILDGSGGVILFDGTTPALYDPPVSGSGSVSGKLIRELEEYTGEITEDIYMPIDLGSGPARKRKLSNIAHSHANKIFLDVINQGLSKESSVQFKDVVATGAITAGALNGTPPDDLPVATGLLYGVVKLDDVTIKLDPVTGKIYSVATGGTSVSWGTEVAGQSIQLNVASVLKTLALSGHTHSQYLTAITKTMVENVLTGIITSHQHNYLPINGGNLTGPLTILTHTAWHAGNDGIGSGLDADLLDGLHAADFFKAVLSNTTDVNNTTFWQNKGGKLYNAPNAPFSYYAFISFGESIYQGQFNAFNNRLMFRAGSESGLSDKPWVEIYHSGNSNLKTVDWNAKDLKCVNTFADGAVVAGALNGTLPNDLPVATSSLFGVVKTGASINNNAGLVNINGRHYTTVSTYTNAAVREITAELALGTGSMANGTLDQIQLSFAPLTTTRGLTANVIATDTGAGMGLKLSFRKDTGTGRWYIMIYNDSGAAVTRDGLLLSIRGQQTI